MPPVLGDDRPATLRNEQSLRISLKVDQERDG
jgi:hypothetical protein